VGTGLQPVGGSVCRCRLDRTVDGGAGYVSEFLVSGAEFRTSGKTQIGKYLASSDLGNNAMSMLYVLIPLAVVLLALAVWALLWAIKNGQFDDLETHGWSVVLDDDQKPPELENDSNPDANEEQNQ